MSRCFIVGAGDYSGGVPKRGDFIIAADGGYTALVSRGITPDLVVGDFDSLGGVPDHPNIIQSPAEKDDTDMMLAIKQGIKRGCRTFIIDGALGGRLDHTLANIQLLTYLAQNGARGVLLGRDICITALKNGAAGFNADASGCISVFSAGGKAGGVTLEGLKYPLAEATLSSDYPVGVSNEFIGAPARISVSDGVIIVTWTCGIEFLDEDKL